MMNKETIATAKALDEAFALNQNNPLLADTKVLWGGAYVYVQSADRSKDLASFKATSFTVRQIMNWCVRNDCRCSSIVGGRVML